MQKNPEAYNNSEKKKKKSDNIMTKQGDMTTDSTTMKRAVMKMMNRKIMAIYSTNKYTHPLTS